MPTPASAGRLHSLLQTAGKHKMLLVVLLGLSVTVGLSNALLRGDVTGSITTAGLTSSSVPDAETDPTRACTTKDTPFDGIPRLAEATKLFEDGMTAIVDERWRLINDPLSWPCFQAPGSTPQPGAMPKLQALADSLPGWSYIDGGDRKTKPVRWENFTSIAGEFEREYECDLTKLEQERVDVVLSNNDVENDTPSASGKPQFCCLVTGNGCRSVATAGDNGSLCDPDTITEDTLCRLDGETPACDVDMSRGDMAGRIANVQVRMTQERTRARTAMERTVNALRSFEMHLPFTIETNCMQRAALDLKNEQAMLADAISCMPKIWDATTSLHDKFVSP